MADLFTYSHLVGLLSLVAAGSAIYLAFRDKKGAALSMTGIFLATAIISQLQYIKSFEAFTVKAQLQDRIERADELIKQLRELSILVAKAGYGSTGISMLALGGIQTSDLTLTKDFDALLSRLKLTQEEKADARRPLLRVIGIKLTGHMANIANRLYELRSTDEARGKTMEAPKLITSNELLQRRLFSLDTPEQMRSMLLDLMPTNLLPDQQASADRFVNKLMAIYEDSLQNGGPSADFIALDRKTLSQENTEETAKAIFEGKVPQ